MGDVVNFIGLNLTGPLVIDNKYSHTTLNGSDISVTKTTDVVLDRTYHNKTIYLDATSNDITITWDCFNMDGVSINFIRKDASGYNIYITDVGTYGTESFIGNGLPYFTALTQYEAIPLTSLADTIYIHH